MNLGVSLRVSAPFNPYPYVWCYQLTSAYYVASVCYPVANLKVNLLCPASLIWSSQLAPLVPDAT